MKNYIIGFVILVVLAVGGYYGYEWYMDRDTAPRVGTEDEQQPLEEGELLMEEENENRIGVSSDGLDIPIARYGEGETELLFVGGIHGGYSWNTALVAYELMDYLESNPDIVPDNVTVSVVPVLNPDGLQKTVGTTGVFSRSDVPSGVDATVPGRFNAKGVDLNRNFDCDWQSVGTWQDREVDGGSRAFSEPESSAIRNYITEHQPDAVVVWYSSAGGVFASNCHNGVLSETRTLVNLYAESSGYPAFEEFDFYEITGDMTNWLAKQRIPAISVLLTTPTDTEWSKNRAGVEALLDHYASQASTDE